MSGCGWSRSVAGFRLCVAGVVQPEGVQLVVEGGLAESQQLGAGIPVVTEPERRDTFPAIALASSYLACERKCPADEVVIVMPCDPYTEAGYFETIRRMADAVKNDAAGLVLMGIRPTYPSAKYGYVVPVPGNDGSGIYPNRKANTPPFQNAPSEINLPAVGTSGFSVKRETRYIPDPSLPGTGTTYPYLADG